MALYYFSGDFIAGDGTEAWLDPITAADANMLADYLSCDDDVWTADHEVARLRERKVS
jgi:hypothetical protein